MCVCVCACVCVRARARVCVCVVVRVSFECSQGRQHVSPRKLIHALDQIRPDIAALLSDHQDNANKSKSSS